VDDLTRLLVSARDGDGEAFRSFVVHTQAEVWRFLAALVGTDEADDATQDTYVRAWRALPAYRADASGRTWLLAIARRAAADAVRRRIRGRRLVQRIAGTRVDRVAPDASGPDAITRLVGDLDPERREAFVLTQVIGCSYAEAAAIIGVPVGTIRSRVARARDDLVRDVRAADTG
jgi:RNA polymerase sigma-70 factor (ECF subfamily)